jgi:hypothetical protein
MRRVEKKSAHRRKCGKTNKETYRFLCEGE